MTPERLETHLSPENTWALYVSVRHANRLEAVVDEKQSPALGASEEDENGPAYWFAGAVWHRTDDQLPRFRSEGIWENGYGYGDKSLELIRRIKAGDRIAIKSSFVKRAGLPFDVGGKHVSAMRIRSTGTILENLDGNRVRVAWDPQATPRDWYFYTYRTTLVEADTEHEPAKRLIDFVFRGRPQDYAWFLAQPYWRDKYGVRDAPATPETGSLETEAEQIVEAEEEPTYTIADIIADGSFLPVDELSTILNRWRQKKNLVLQGPPGTGKTWLAKRLGFALVGSNDREVTRSRLRIVQFHPSLAYEDFVRGWRPAGNGGLTLVDGILMQAIDAAKSEPDLPFVLVIEEINRGNPAQILGEMLTLLEDTKRRASEAIELAYRRDPGERVYIPKNLYVIGTMNVADRSLAIVDLALRRRFAFVDLTPRFGEAWRAWGLKRGLSETMLSEIEVRIEILNKDISQTVSLGPQFRIGHSYVTPDIDEMISNEDAWFRAKVEAEIGPLLDEYWYDSPERANAARAKLLPDPR